MNAVGTPDASDPQKSRSSFLRPFQDKPFLANSFPGSGSHHVLHAGLVWNTVHTCNVYRLSSCGGKGSSFKLF